MSGINRTVVFGPEDDLSLQHHRKTHLRSGPSTARRQPTSCPAARRRFTYGPTSPPSCLWTPDRTTAAPVSSSVCSTCTCDPTSSSSWCLPTSATAPIDRSNDGPNPPGRPDRTSSSPTGSSCGPRSNSAGPTAGKPAYDSSADVVDHPGPGGSSRSCGESPLTGPLVRLAAHAGRAEGTGAWSGTMRRVAGTEVCRMSAVEPTRAVAPAGRSSDTASEFVLPLVGSQ